VIHLRGRHPSRRRVASLAHVGAGDMRCGLAHRTRTIVTRTTAAVGFIVIHGHHRHPGTQAVAGFTDFSGINVASRFARGNRRIVTTETTVCHANMVKYRTDPRRRVVAIIASTAGRNVCCVFTGSDNAIVARFARTVNLGMIHRRHRNPTRWCVTGITLIGGINMRGGFTSGRHAVMTTLASAACFVVIHRGNRYPARIDVAGFTKIRGINVRCSTAAFARGNGAIVTSDTRICCRTVIERAHKPHGGNVANIAGFGGRHMGCTLADRNHPVVAAFAGTRNLCVIYRNRWNPCRAVVASLTYFRCGDMCCALADGRACRLGLDG